ncbi:response regulator transcription factor [Cohnella fermenti]|uniref:Response regulator transcription factor n=2 Tax=Cohnella fermenti TaxID=2565925 RepID=A0A4S4BNA7_9BACL|nr:response regulator transcription factor [Cohnella fermenti]
MERTVKARVLIVDDQTIMREGLETLLTYKSEVEVVGMAGSGEEALTLAAELAPDVVLMDIRMPGMGGVAATRALAERHPGIVVLILTTFDDDDYIIEALSHGAAGYLLKDIGSKKLIDSIYEAMAGSLLLTGKVARKLALSARGGDGAAGGSFPPPRDRFELTARELEIANLLAEGNTSKEMADRLFLTRGTVKNYLSSIYSKIGTNDRAKALLALRELVETRRQRE